MKPKDLRTIGTSMAVVFLVADALICACAHFSNGAAGFRMRLYPATFAFELLGLSLMVAALVMEHRDNGKRR